MWNCCVVVSNGEKIAIFKTILAAEAYVTLCKAAYGCPMEFHIDWAYIPNLPF